MATYANGQGNCRKCGYPLDIFSQCDACRIRRREGLSENARCRTCAHYGHDACRNRLANAVCALWRTKEFSHDYQGDQT